MAACFQLIASLIVINESGSQPRAVGKRTPRIPVSHSQKRFDRENFISPIKRSLKSEGNANDDEVAHVAALALTEAAQRGGSPHVSQTQYKRAGQKSSPVQSWVRMLTTLLLKESIVF